MRQGRWGRSRDTSCPAYAAAAAGATKETVFTRIGIARIAALEFTTNTFELTLRKLVFIQKVRQYVI